MRNLIYRLYEGKIERALRAADLPKHIGVIVDGNRRWATKQGGKAKHGHLAGAAKIPQFLVWCDELGIKVVTIYLLSTDNLTGRSASELDALQKIIGGLATDNDTWGVFAGQNNDNKNGRWVGTETVMVWQVITLRL